MKLNEQIKELIAQQNSLRTERDKLIEDVKLGRWYKLRELVSDEDIESLSEIEPVDPWDTFLGFYM